MEKIRFSRLLGDGAILQRNKEIHIWGYAWAHKKVKVYLLPDGDNEENLGEEVKCVCDEKGRFDAVFEKRQAGGPYAVRAVTVTDEGEPEELSSVEIGNVYVGDVFVISGQSNMEFPMARVRDTYPEEWDNPYDEFIRTFKVVENGVFGEPVEDVLTGEWLEFNKESIDNYSAVGYFMAKRLRQSEDVPVGLINVSLGGAPIEAFMSREMLEGFDETLADADRFLDEEYRKKVLEENDFNSVSWHSFLDENDTGLSEKWEDGKKILCEGSDFMVPEYFSDTELSGLIGSVWFARKFNVPKEYAGKEALLWFGTITDYDFCYVNGKMIGTTPYCYPPRRYPIPEGLLKEGENTIVFRICVEKGFGRITPGKLLGVIFGQGRRISDGFVEKIQGAEKVIELSGVWKYLKGCCTDETKEINPCEETVFVNWKPTALFNGMLAPVTNYPIKAFCFYQGETNCPRAFEYAKLTARQVEGYRKLWKDENLPYICVKLPNFSARVEESSYDGTRAWRNLQSAQEEVRKLPDAYCVDVFGSGENNDLHPQRKEPVGRAIAEVVIGLS